MEAVAKTALIFVLALLPSFAMADCERAEGSKPLTKRVDCLSKRVGEQAAEISRLNNLIVSVESLQREHWSVACVNNVCVGVHGSGVIVGFNKDPYNQYYRRVLSNVKPPLDVECHLNFNDEICTIVESSGQVWFGYLRDANSWRPMDGLLSLN